MTSKEQWVIDGLLNVTGLNFGISCADAARICGPQARKVGSGVIATGNVVADGDAGTAIQSR
jgi:hypothetical protein